LFSKSIYSFNDLTISKIFKSSKTITKMESIIKKASNPVASTQLIQGGGGVRDHNQTPSTIRTKVLDFLLSLLPLSIVQLIWQFAPFLLDGNDQPPSASLAPRTYSVYFSKSVSKMEKISYLSNPNFFGGGAQFFHTFYVVHSIVTSTPEKVNNLLLDDMDLGEKTRASSTTVDRSTIPVVSEWTEPKQFIVLIPSDLFAKGIRNFTHFEHVESLKIRTPNGYLVLELPVFLNLVRKNQLSADVSTITKVESTHHSSMGFRDNSRAVLFFNTKNIINNFLELDFYTPQHVSVYETVTLKDGIEIKRHGLPADFDPRCFYEEKTSGIITGFTSSLVGNKRSFDEISGDGSLGGGRKK
jgi:hypothetical protein